MDLMDRIKDLQTTVPGIIVAVVGFINFAKEYGVVIDITQTQMFWLAIIVAGIGLILSGGKKAPDEKKEDKVTDLKLQ
jgi:DhnA family fructose-bisphosphate aldolase class Ia